MRREFISGYQSMFILYTSDWQRNKCAANSASQALRYRREADSLKNRHGLAAREIVKGRPWLHRVLRSL